MPVRRQEDWRLGEVYSHRTTHQWPIYHTVGAKIRGANRAVVWDKSVLNAYKALVTFPSVIMRMFILSLLRLNALRNVCWRHVLTIGSYIYRSLGNVAFSSLNTQY